MDNADVAPHLTVTAPTDEPPIGTTPRRRQASEQGGTGTYYPLQEGILSDSDADLLAKADACQDQDEVLSNGKVPSSLYAFFQKYKKGRKRSGDQVDVCLVAREDAEHPAETDYDCENDVLSEIPDDCLSSAGRLSSFSPRGSIRESTRRSTNRDKGRSSSKGSSTRFTDQPRISSRYSTDQLAQASYKRVTGPRTGSSTDHVRPPRLTAETRDTAASHGNVTGEVRPSLRGSSSGKDGCSKNCGGDEKEDDIIFAFEETSRKDRRSRKSIPVPTPGKRDSNRALSPRGSRHSSPRGSRCSVSSSSSCKAASNLSAVLQQVKEIKGEVDPVEPAPVAPAEEPCRTSLQSKRSSGEYPGALPLVVEEPPPSPRRPPIEVPETRRDSRKRDSLQGRGVSFSDDRQHAGVNATGEDVEQTAIGWSSKCLVEAEKPRASSARDDAVRRSSSSLTSDAMLIMEGCNNNQSDVAVEKKDGPATDNNGSNAAVGWATVSSPEKLAASFAIIRSKVLDAAVKDDEGEESAAPRDTATDWPSLSSMELTPTFEKLAASYALDDSEGAESGARFGADNSEDGMRNTNRSDTPSSTCEKSGKAGIGCREEVTDFPLLLDSALPAEREECTPTTSSRSASVAGGSSSPLEPSPPTSPKTDNPRKRQRGRFSTAPV